MSRTGRAWHAILWFLEIVAIVLVVLLLMFPIQDYARREHLTWYLQPTTENWQAFQVKQREEFLVLFGVATPIAVVAVFLALRLRFKSRKTG